MSLFRTKRCSTRIVLQGLRVSLTSCLSVESIESMSCECQVVQEIQSGRWQAQPISRAVRESVDPGKVLRSR